MTAIYDFLSQPPPRPVASTPAVSVVAASPGTAPAALDAVRNAAAPARLNGRSADRRPRVAVVVDRLSSHQARLVQGVEAGLRRQGVDLMVYLARPEEDRTGAVMADLLAGAQLSGLLCTATPTATGGGLDELLRRVGDLPLVVLGAHLPQLFSVGCDNAAAMASLMAHLLDEAEVRHPAFVRGGSMADSLEREQGFRTACADRGIEVVESRLLYGDSDRARAYRASMALVRADRDVDAIVVANDEMADGVLDALAEQGLDVPTQVKVTGFDGDARSAASRPPLTTIDQRLHEQGEAAADLLLAQLDGDRQVRAVRIEGRLIVRRSTRPYRAAPGRRAPRESLAAERDSLIQVVQTEIGPCPPVVDSTWARRWLERLRDQMETGHLDEAWIRSWGRPTGTVDDLERATTWLAGASRVVLDLVWRQFRGGDDQSFAAADIHGHVVARLAVVRADGTRSSDRSDLLGLRHVIAMNHALSAATSPTTLAEEVVTYLPQLGVSRCYLVLFDPDPAGGEPGARVVLAYVDGELRSASDPGYTLGSLLLGADAANGPVMTFQPLIRGGSRYGLLIYRQDPTLGYAADAVALDLAARVEATVSRHAADDSSRLRALLASTTARLDAALADRVRVEDELRAARLELSRSRLVDPLTGLANQAGLDDVMEREVGAHAHSRRPLAVVMIDLGIPSFDDRHGPQQGDDALRTVAALLTDAARRGGDVVARPGGGEFTLVLPDTDARGAARVGGGVLDLVRDAGLTHDGVPPGRLTISVGVASLVPSGPQDAADLVSAASTALAQARGGGRDTVVVADETVVADVTAPAGAGARPALAPGRRAHRAI